jgi:hypothetical protein
MAHYDVKIEKYEDYVRPAQPVYRDLERGLNLGDTVSFSSSQGKIRIHIVDKKTRKGATPFKEPGSIIIQDQRVRTVSNEGKYLFRCKLKPKGAKEYIGWKRGNGNGEEHSGVEVPVPPPRP